MPVRLLGQVLLLQRQLRSLRLRPLLRQALEVLAVRLRDAAERIQARAGFVEAIERDLALLAQLVDQAQLFLHHRRADPARGDAFDLAALRFDLRDQLGQQRGGLVELGEDLAVFFLDAGELGALLRELRPVLLA
jgi:hypothetical protein